MEDRETRDYLSAQEGMAASDARGATFGSPEDAASASSNADLLSGTGSIPAAAALGSLDDAPAPSTPRYVRQRAPHRSQGTVDDLNHESQPSPTYTHDSNISVGGATPLSGMAYRRSRSNISRVQNGSRYGQYLEIPKGRRSIFASRERARRRRSVLALVVVVTLLVLAAMFLWSIMQRVLN